jgi:hypothetical protein
MGYKAGSTVCLSRSVYHPGGMLERLRVENIQEINEDENDA